MIVLNGEEEKIALDILLKTADLAKDATCSMSKCASIFVKDNQIIGAGYNSPPGNIESQRRCNYSKDSYHKKITDKTCCIHAEQRAIIDALTRHPDMIKGSRLYFARLKDGQMARAGKPYCTICSKMALDAGIAEFTLWHNEGIIVYDTKEYNRLSYEYRE